MRDKCNKAADWLSGKCLCCWIGHLFLEETLTPKRLLSLQTRANRTNARWNKTDSEWWLNCLMERNPYVNLLKEHRDTVAAPVWIRVKDKIEIWNVTWAQTVLTGLNEAVIRKKTWMERDKWGGVGSVPAGNTFDKTGTWERKQPTTMFKWLM